MACLKQRSGIYLIQYYIGGKQRRVSLSTDSLQIAKEKLRQFESAQAAGDNNPLPTRTPLPEIVGAYVDHVRAVKTAKSAQTDVYYLRDAFGPICPALEITSRKVGPASKKRPPKPGQDCRRRAPVIEAACLEQVTTRQVTEFISGQVASRGLAPKTANRYREILCRLFNWAMEQRGVKIPNGRNPVSPVERYKERAPEIRFLTLAQIDEQLDALKTRPQLQVMVAMLIYAGLRREELLWLTHDDIDLAAKPFGLLRIRSKTIDGRFWQSKTGINRAVPISSSLRAYLDTYRPRIVPGGWYFPSPDGKWWDPRQLFPGSPRRQYGRPFPLGLS
jgi:hypothetical protein